MNVEKLYEEKKKYPFMGLMIQYPLLDYSGIKEITYGYTEEEVLFNLEFLRAGFSAIGMYNTKVVKNPEYVKKDTETDDDLDIPTALELNKVKSFPCLRQIIARKLKDAAIIGRTSALIHESHIRFPKTLLQELFNKGYKISVHYKANVLNNISYRVTIDWSDITNDPKTIYDEIAGQEITIDELFQRREWC